MQASSMHPQLPKESSTCPGPRNHCLQQFLIFVSGSFSRGSVGGVSIIVTAQRFALAVEERRSAGKPHAAADRRNSTPANMSVLSPLFTQIHAPFGLLYGSE